MENLYEKKWIIFYCIKKKNCLGERAAKCPSIENKKKKKLKSVTHNSTPWWWSQSSIPTKLQQENYFFFLSFRMDEIWKEMLCRQHSVQERSNLLYSFFFSILLILPIFLTPHTFPFVFLLPFFFSNMLILMWILFSTVSPTKKK